MTKNLLFFIAIFTCIFCCRTKNSLPSEKATETQFEYDSLESVKTIEASIAKFVDTKYEYVDTKDNLLIVENSLPKGGQTYTDVNGQKYVYAIFWTLITNQTDQIVELNVKFASDPLLLPSSPDNSFKIFLPQEEMLRENAPLYNYGLQNLPIVLDNKLHDGSSIHRFIKSQETISFYVITLFKKGFDGVVRAGLSLKEDIVYYRVKDLEIEIGQINLKELKPKN